MCEDRIIRRFAGVFVLAGVLLTWLVHPAWLLFVAFVGANLLQSSFTRLCPLENILARFGWAGCAGRTSPAQRGTP